MTDRKKVVIVGPAFPLRGGIANFNEALSRELNLNGQDSELVSFSYQYPKFLFPGKTQFAEGKGPEDLKIYTIINSINPLNWIKTAKFIAGLKPDYVIIRFWLPFMGLALGTIAGKIRKKGIKVIAITDNVIPHESRLGDRWLTKYFLRRCDGFITLSKSVLNDISQFTDNQNKIMLSHPVYSIFGESVSRSLGLDKLKLDVDSKYILFFGLIRGYKGLDLALKALQDYRIKELGIKLIIAGEFYDKKEKYLKLLDANKGSVLLYDHYIPQEEVKYYFAVADCVVQPYKTATQSGITQVAYNFNKPMIVTNVGGLPEIVAHGRVGYVTELNQTAIADAIVRFYVENKKAEFEINVEQDKEKFSWKYFVDSLADFEKAI
jgi:glycosyltransferase involved in cell wall biosynthesis